MRNKFLDLSLWFITFISFLVLNVWKKVLTSMNFSHQMSVLWISMTVVFLIFYGNVLVYSGLKVNMPKITESMFFWVVVSAVMCLVTTINGKEPNFLGQVCVVLPFVVLVCLTAAKMFIHRNTKRNVCARKCLVASLVTIFLIIF